MTGPARSAFAPLIKQTQRVLQSYLMLRMHSSFARRPCHRQKVCKIENLMIGVDCTQNSYHSAATELDRDVFAILGGVLAEGIVLRTAKGKL